MKSLTLAVLVFLISLIAYSWIGFLWVFSSNSPAQTSNIQSVVVFSVVGAALTALGAYTLEEERYVM
jgi:hypothetical protein